MSDEVLADLQTHGSKKLDDDMASLRGCHEISYITSMPRKADRAKPSLTNEAATLTIDTLARVQADRGLTWVPADLVHTVSMTKTFHSIALAIGSRQLILCFVRRLSCQNYNLEPIIDPSGKQP